MKLLVLTNTATRLLAACDVACSALVEPLELPFFTFEWQATKKIAHSEHDKSKNYRHHSREADASFLGLHTGLSLFLFVEAISYFKDKISNK